MVFDSKKNPLATLVATPESVGPVALLGKNRVTPPNRAFVRVATASRLMAGHWKKTGENLRGSSVLGCGRWRNYGADPNIAEIEIPHEGTPRMLGHFACRASWSCDHCARARVSQTRSWLRAALMPAMTVAGLTGGLLTFTLAHSYGDDWSQVVARLFDAFTLFDRRMSKWYLRVGCLGKLKALEAPVGVHGLHPHLHVLMTYRADVDPSELADMEAAMAMAWSNAVAEVGGRSNVHGFDFKRDCVNDYAAKLETSHELASHGTKKARGAGRLLAQLLDRAAVGDAKAGAEWLRAQAALGGRKRFHAGALPKKLGIPSPSEWEDDERDAELDAERVERPEPARITYPQAHHLKATGTTGRAGLAVILRAARTADPSKVLRVVAALCAEVDRKEVAADTVQRFADWTDDHFQNIVNEAGARVLQPDEVPAYIEAKARGLTQTQTPKLDTVVTMENTPAQYFANMAANYQAAKAAGMPPHLIVPDATVLGMGEAHGSEAEQTEVDKSQNQDAGRGARTLTNRIARHDKPEVRTRIAAS